MGNDGERYEFSKKGKIREATKQRNKESWERGEVGGTCNFTQEKANERERLRAHTKYAGNFFQN